MTDIRYHDLPDGRRIAFRLAEPSPDNARPTLVFLPGYMSDMAGGKATALFDHCASTGRGCLLMDYSGCGQSSGDFADGTLGRWRDEVLALIDAHVAGPVLVVGSSMGGWLMLMVGMALGQRLAGLVGIASAPDFTDWGRSEEDKETLGRGETVFDPNPYGPEPTPMHPGFFADGQDNLLLGSPIPITCPVRLLHGQADADVPWETSLRLADALESRDVVVTLVKGGDHRLSREEDIARLIAIVEDAA